MKNKPFPFTVKPVALIVATLCLQSAGAQTSSTTPQVELDPVVTTGHSEAAPFATVLAGEPLYRRRMGSNDTARLLKGLPGMAFYAGGGVSSLPAMDGLADDRLKITVDGMSITSACPNHMNPALSYIDPSAVKSLVVFAGVVPVSQGGDSVGGSISVQSTQPKFTQPGEGQRVAGTLSAFWRSNGNVRGASAQASWEGERMALRYQGNTVEADNYKDGRGVVVPASRYKVHNQSLLWATKFGSDTASVELGMQGIPYQGYPNQAMDMVKNSSLSVNASYDALVGSARVRGRAYRQHVAHKMDLLPEKNSGHMPMDTDAADLGYSLSVEWPWSERSTARLGHEFHRYELDDWWPPLATGGFMAPHDFWNVRDGKRERLAAYAEVDSRWSAQWSTQWGFRLERVSSDAGPVQGYHSAADGAYPSMNMMGDMVMRKYSDVTYQNDANAFNALPHRRVDHNLDVTLAARYEPGAQASYEFGASRKTRSPNLHERYTWSNEAVMAGLMNNWFGDLNSYVGDINLKPEVAYAIKGSANWHDADRKRWQLTLSPHYTYLNDYIGVAPNRSVNPYNMSMIPGRRSLRLVNTQARLWGANVSGSRVLGESDSAWTASFQVSQLRGRTEVGVPLYNLMPLNMRVGLEHRWGAWSNSLDFVAVREKNSVDSVRAERPSPGYALLNYHGRYQAGKNVRLDFGVENLLDRNYRLPLGGLEYASFDMMTGRAPQTLRAMGRSLQLGVSVGL